MATELLATLAQCKSWLAIDAGDTSSDSLLTDLVTEASADFFDYTNRPQMALSSASYTDNLNGSGGPIQYLPKGPVSAVASVVVDGRAVSASGSPQTPGFVFDENAVYLRRCGIFCAGFQNVTITYTAGYATAPEDIRTSVKQLVGFWFRERNRIGEKSKALGPMQTGAYVTALDGIPNTILSIWNRYTRTAR